MSLSQLLKLAAADDADAEAQEIRRALAEAGLL